MSTQSKNIQSQQQKLEQRQTLSQQQVLFVRLLELPTEGLEERIRTEVLENPALEEADDHMTETGTNIQDMENPSTDSEEEEGNDGEYYDEEYPPQKEESYENEIDENILAALGDYRSEDDIPDYERTDYYNPSARTGEEIPYSETTSFYEILKGQLSESSLDEEEREIAEYLIGSLDDDGLLRKELDNIIDELAIYRGMYIQKDKLLKVLHVIQEFDPIGIGARNLQECLQLQLRHRPDSPAKKRAQQILDKHYDDFTHKRWERIMEKLLLADKEFQEAVEELTRLNPRPGSSLSESVDKGLQQIVPDFIVWTDDEGNIRFTLNDNNVPELRISESFNDIMQEYSQNTPKDRQSQEIALFVKQKIEAAQSFIDIIKLRHHTLTVTMQAIIDWQRPFFREGDERLLRPMLLKDIAGKTGLDISTVSRVSNSKYAETDFGILPLKYFFGDSYHRPAIVRPKEEKLQSGTDTKQNSEETTLRQIRALIQECVKCENKQHPLNDEQLAKILQEKGFDMARRTVAKYRQQLGIPVARMRRK